MPHTNARTLLLLTLAAVALIHVTGAQTNMSPTFRTLQALGAGILGFAGVEATFGGIALARRLAARGIVNLALRGRVDTSTYPRVMPSFFAVDIAGCITPANRDEIDLGRLSRVAAYTAFIRDKPDYPPIVLFTGRSQGYVEILCQLLRLVETYSLDVPHVIENGSALYYPRAKRTEVLISPGEVDKIRTTARALETALPGVTFEPKSYMITLNPRPGQSIDSLMSDTVSFLTDRKLNQEFNISSTATAVDLTVLSASKLKSLQRVQTVLQRHPVGPLQGLPGVVALGDQLSDLEVLFACERGYCPRERVHPQVREYIERRFSRENVIPGSDLDVLEIVLERECGIEID